MASRLKSKQKAATLKTAKTPQITSQTKLLCFDLETNGLHGQAFAIGALVIDMQGKVHDQFTARIRLTSKVDQWVADNVLPAIADMEVTHKNYKEMREAFWTWFVTAQAKSDYTIVSNGYPVEYRFLLDCQDADIEARYWQHPFPLIDLSSLLLGLGQLTEGAKKDLANKATKDESLKSHHPLHDAKATALTAIEALRSAKL